MQKFNEKINKVKNAFKGIEDKNIHVGFDGAEIESIKIKMQELQGLLEANAKKPFMSSEEVMKTRVQLEKLNKQYEKLVNNQSKTNGSLSFNETAKGIDKVTSKMKRFALSLFSIRSIYSLVSKASSVYLAQDTELADKLQSVWAGLGSMLAPIIEGIANILMKAVGYINIFVKALTGVDLLAKASVKSMDKVAKSAKGLNKSLAGFDELNNLDTDAGSNIDTGISNPFASIQNVDLPWAETIKAFGEWCKDNLPTVIGLLGGLAGAIVAIKWGLGGIKALGIGGLIFSIIKLVGDLKDLLEEPTWEKFGRVVQDIGLAILFVGMIVGGVPAMILGALTLIVGYVIEHWDEIKESTKLLWDFVKAGFWTLVSVIEGIFTTIALIIRAPFDMLWDLVQDVFNGIRTILGGIVKVFKGIFTGDLKTVLEGFKQIFKGIFDSLWAIVKAPLNLIIRGINALISGINIIKFDVPDWVPGIGGKRLGFNIPKIPLLNAGTNYVPEDQLAYIHKGEAVVPKKFNSQEYFGTGNNETNSLLEQVIDAINNIEINPYTTVKDVGRATVNYVREKERQTGRSVFA